MNKIYFGDCRKIMRDLIADEMTVQCCVTSPPYWGLRDYGSDGQLGLEPTINEYIANMVEVFSLVRGLLADNGVLWLNMGDSYARDAKKGQHKPGDSGKQAYIYDRGGGRASSVDFASESRGSSDGKVGRADRAAVRVGGNGLKPKDLIGQPWRLAFALQESGWYLRQDIIWHKPNPMPESVADRCTKSHEYIFLLSKSERYYFDQGAIQEQADVSNFRDRATSRRKAPPGQSPDAGFKNGSRYETRNKRSVWTVPTQPYGEAHFATFPPKLIEPCILAASRVEDIVFDPFMGSGTTAQVAQNLGRNWLGCEINEDYEPMQQKRTAQSSMIL